MTKKQWTALGLFLFLVVGFFVVSAILAHIHCNTLVVEWQTWFGIVKDVVIPPEDSPVIVENLFKAKI